jgi:hypothetical protein
MEGFMQMKSLRYLGAVAAGVAVGLAGVASLANAASVVPPAVIKAAASSNVEAAGWRGRGWGGRAGYYEPYYQPYYSSYYRPHYEPYYPRYYYYYPAPVYYYPRAYYPAPLYPGRLAGDAVAYCMQRFQSYDLGSGTYLGYDGYRHPCP